MAHRPPPVRSDGRRADGGPMSADEPSGSSGSAHEQDRRGIFDTEALDAPDPLDSPGDADHSPRRVRRVLMSLGALSLVLALVAGFGLWFLTDRYAGNIDRLENVFADLDEDSRPAQATPAVAASEEPVTFLLVGSDTLGHPADG